MKGLETFVDFFAGIGGFRIGGENNGLKCVAACDWDQFARQTYAKNFGHEPEFSNIRDVKGPEVPDHDLFTGGFPCQPFSLAGKRLGLNDSRGTLFNDIARVLEAKQPNYFLLENVKGLLSAPVNDEAGEPIPGTGGWVFYHILGTLGELGYNVQWQVLDVRHWLPQNRERVYIIGSSTRLPAPEVFPIFDYAGSVEGNTGRRKGTAVLDGPIGKLHTHQGGRVYGKNSASPTLDTSRGPYLDCGDGLRLMTPCERERLMGFPDGWTEGVSDAQRYRQTGNAVCTRPVTEILRVLIDCHGNGGPRPEGTTE